MTTPRPRPPRDEDPNLAAIAGLASEVEGLRRRLEGLEDLAQEVEGLAADVRRFGERSGPPAQSMAAAVPSWLALNAAGVTARELAAEMLATLVRWMREVYLRFPDAAQSLPECWLWHPEVVEELLWLRHAWFNAHHTRHGSAQHVGDWHDRARPGVVSRIRGAAGTCSIERHPAGRDRHLPARSPAMSDAVEAVVSGWTVAREQP